MCHPAPAGERGKRRGAHEHCTAASRPPCPRAAGGAARRAHNTRSYPRGQSQVRGDPTAPHHRTERGPPPLCAHQHADDILSGVGPAPGEYDGAPPLAVPRPSPGPGGTPAKAGGGGRGAVPPVRGACGAGAVLARPGSQGGSRDFLLEEAALWQLPVGDGGGGGGWGKGPPAFIETRWRGAGSAGAEGRRAGAPLPHPDNSAANPSAPGEARGPCAVTAPHCLRQPPSMEFWPGRRLSRDHRDAARGAEPRSVPAVPPQGPHVPDAQGNGRTPSPNLAPHLLASAAGTWCWTRFQQPSEPPALPCSWHSNILHTAAGDAARPAAPNLPPSPGVQMSIPAAAPSQALRSHQLITSPV